MTITYRDALPEDFAAIVPHLREADCEEWREASGKTPAEHLRDSSWAIPQPDPERSVQNFRCRVAVDAQGPVLLYGVDPGLIRGWGWVWLIACNRAEKHVLEFHKSWASEMALLLDLYPQLYTASWVKNTKHHRWLKWIGFKPFGVPVRNEHGGPFQPFKYGD